jgi:hypothetical protein
VKPRFVNRLLQKNIAILLKYLHMLRPQKNWSYELVSKPELELEVNKDCWTIVKNDKTNISDIDFKYFFSFIKNKMK